MPIRCVQAVLYGVMDDIDRQIVALLRENARRSFQDIGARVALSAPAVKRRVDRLEADGVIRAYAAVLEPGRDGLADARRRRAVLRGADGGGRGPRRGRAASGGRRPRSRSRARRARSSTCTRATPPTSSRRSSASATRPGIIRTQTQVVLSTLLDRPVAG